MTAASILILEDERSAANQLKVELEQLDNWKFNILAEFETIRESALYLNEHPAPDLIFMDIQLADGISLDIFSRFMLPCPVIFCTAYDRYAVEAFHLNAIDYLLKPIDSSKLQRALDVFRERQREFSPALQLAHLQTALKRLDRPPFRTSFLIYEKQRMMLVQTSQIAYFILRDRKVHIHTDEDHDYRLDLSLEQLDKQLDTSVFFRANRQVIISKSAIRDIEPYGAGKLLVNLQPVCAEKVIISKERVPQFKQWANA